MMWDFSGGGNRGVPPYSPIPYSEDQYQPYAGPSMGSMPPYVHFIYLHVLEPRDRDVP